MKNKIYDLVGIIKKIAYHEALCGTIPNKIKDDIIEIVRTKNNITRGFRLKIDLTKLIVLHDEKGNITGWKQSNENTITINEA